MKRNTKILLATTIGLFAIAVALSIGVFSIQNKSNVTGATEITLYQGITEFDTEPKSFQDLLALEKPLIVNFWGASCPPCLKEIPLLQQIHEKYSSKITVLGVDMGPNFILGSHEQGKVLLSELGATYPAGIVNFQKSREQPNHYQLNGEFITGLPSTFFMNSEGKIIKRSLGLLQADTLYDIAEALIESH
ncbi:MAG: TlpA family protein disulfide reductase [SAR202 cluster bacterium]|nr:TlpA family protein disulfide reductase [SAR202 cluster bacterium]|tara:strand:+ start:214 stop:786 length:573 start_codon:yes stop_codon:yes gene_type:complete